jgi:hypothetical protein
MTSKHNGLLARLGILRMALILLALLNILLPLIGILAPMSAQGDDHSQWSVLMTVIAPVMAPLFVVVLFFDYIMSRVQAADAEGTQRKDYTLIGRITLVVIGFNLLFWVPYFIWLL